MKKISLLMALCLSAAAAGWSTTITITAGGTSCPTAGLCSSVPGATTIDFNGATGTTYTHGIATITSDPLAASPFVIGSSSGQYAAPPSDNTSYLSVGSPSGPADVFIAFSSAITYYGLYLGSPDDYNSISFYEHAGDLTPLVTFTGEELYPAGHGNQSLGKYINFSVHGGSIEQVVLSSSMPAFETDNHAYSAVPEPATVSLTFMGVVCVWVARKLMMRSRISIA